MSMFLARIKRRLQELIGIALFMAVLPAAATPPTVSILRPSMGATYTTSSTIPVRITTAAAAGGVVAKVDLYLNNSNTPFWTTGTLNYASITFDLPGGGISISAAGSYSITAKATDGTGAVTTSSAVNIKVYAPTANVAPAVSIALPLNGEAYQASTGIPNLAVSASANSGGSINRVELFYYDGSNNSWLGTITSPVQSYYQASCVPPGCVFPAGTYALTAVAYDNLGAATISGAKTITVYTSNPADQAPTVNLVQPPNGGIYVSPAVVPALANPVDSDGAVNRVEFSDNGALFAVVTSSPYALVNASTGTLGVHTLKALAYDNIGVPSTAAASTITINASNTPPTVSLTAPTANALFNQPTNVSLSANASAPELNDSVAKLEFFAGATLIGTATTAPWNAVWVNPAFGTYSITAKATDGFGASTTIAAVSVVVNAPPLVSLTIPPRLTGYIAPATVQLNATASDPDGSIQKVEFYSGTTKVGTATSAPWSATLLTVPAGSYSYFARAYDNRGITTDSTPYALTVSTNATPVIFNYDEMGRLTGATH